MFELLIDNHVVFCKVEMTLRTRVFMCVCVRVLADLSIDITLHMCSAQRLKKEKRSLKFYKYTCSYLFFKKNKWGWKCEFVKLLYVLSVFLVVTK